MKKIDINEVDYFMNLKINLSDDIKLNWGLMGCSNAFSFK